MEWMLQVVDEVDDAICTVKHRWLGLRIELGALLLLHGIALAVAGAAAAWGFGIAVAAAGAALAAGLGVAS